MLAENEIRILELLPSPDGEAPITCDVRVAPLSAELDYEALSYCWGDQTIKETIIVSGREVTITRSLYHAIRQLRLPEKKRALWIDQLCVDQWNLEEKAQQVQLMRSIYKFCHTCLVWLGDIQQGIPLADAEAATEIVRYMAAATTATDSNSLPIPASLSESQSAFDNVMSALQTAIVGCNPWWGRIWTVQEAAIPIALVLHWGPLTLPWETVTLATRCWTQTGLPPALQNLMTPRNESILGELMVHSIWLNITKLCVEEPLDIINRWRFRQATDPRDKVYGLLGLCQPGSLPITEKCDYTSSAANVYRTFTLELIISGRDLRPLIGHPRVEEDKATPGIASWAIDLADASNTYSTDVYYFPYGYPCYNANKLLEPLNTDALVAQLDKTTLALTGVYVDRVVLVESGYRTREAGNWNVSTVDVLRAWHNIAKGLGSNQTTEDDSDLYFGYYSYDKAFASLVLGDKVRNTEQRPIRDVTIQDIDSVLGFMESGPADNEIRRTLHGMLTNQTFFTTELGFMGCGHLDTQPGDEVWVLRGGRVPFVLRPREDSSEFTFVGQGYVQGIMQGEMFEDGTCKMGAERTIHIV